MPEESDQKYLSVDVTILHAWSLMKLGDCAKSCLLQLLVDSGSDSEHPSGPSSNVGVRCNRYMMAKKLGSTYRCSTVYRAIDRLMEEEAVIVDDNGNIVLNGKMLTWKPDSFKDDVAGLANRNNLTLQQEEYSEKLEMSNPDYSHGRKHYSEISEQPPQNYSSICSDYSHPRTEYSDICAEGSSNCTNYSEPRTKCSEKPEAEPPVSCKKGKNEPKMDANDADNSREREQPRAASSVKMANPDSSTDVFPDQITSEIAKEHISELQAEFIRLLSKKLLFSCKQVEHDIESASLTSVRLFIALARVYVAVAGGYKLRDIRGALLDVAKNPDKWPAVNPVELNIRLHRIRQADSAG